MLDKIIKTVPNQRVIRINKSPTDKKNLYTTINLSAIDTAAGLLLSTAGFKLYIYLAKNQNKYTFALSSKDFMEWSGCGKTAYTTAFNELVKQGYLIRSKTQINHYSFYDSPHFEDEEADIIMIDYPEEKEGFHF